MMSPIHLNGTDLPPTYILHCVVRQALLRSERQRACRGMFERHTEAGRGTGIGLCSHAGLPELSVRESCDAILHESSR